MKEENKGRWATVIDLSMNHVHVQGIHDKQAAEYS